jgi:PEP-CTERM motif
MLACTLAIPPRAAADPVKLPVGPDNGFVAVYVSYNDGATAFTNVVQLDGTGHGTFTPPHQSHVNKFIAINVGTTRPTSLPPFTPSTDVTEATIFKFSPDALDAFAGHQLPTFAVTDTSLNVVAVVDVSDLVAGGTPFTPGETLTVVNGATPASSAILFLDDASLSPGIDLSTLNALADPAVLDGLPLYTGTVVVDFPIAIVPEPATWAMMLVGFAGLGALLRRRRIAA